MIKDLKEFPSSLIDRINKSCLVLEKISLHKISPSVRFSNVGTAMIITRFGRDLYIKMGDFRREDLENLPTSKWSVKPYAICDIVINSRGHIEKNRWGVEEAPLLSDKQVKYTSNRLTVLFDTMSYEEIEKMSTKELRKYL